jgi:hypothetical protein
MSPAHAVFHERQRFTQAWLWILVGGLTAMIWHATWLQLALGRPFGSKPASDTMLLVYWMAFGWGLPALFLAARLDTVVDAGGISVRFRPFHWRPRRWSFAEIAHIEARSYSPVFEYGGWGIRLGPAGQAYNVRGSRGVQIALRSGARILIGTQRPDAFIRAVEEARQFSSRAPPARR